MGNSTSGGRSGTGDDLKNTVKGQQRALRVTTLVARLQSMQKLVQARHFAVLRMNGNGFSASRRKLTCVLDNWGPASEENAHQLLSAYGADLVAHLDASLLPLLWNGASDHQVAEAPDFTRFTTRLKGRVLPYCGIAFPVRLGAEGNGYVVFAGSAIDASSDVVVDLHGRSCQVMTDLLAADEKRAVPAEGLNEREIACLQLAGDGFTSEEIAAKRGLSAHTVNAYLGSAQSKLDAVNRSQAIAKAIRLGYIR
ncbi:transcriptional regulator VisR [Ensifer soli]|uniref:transcriptional regulator VisR n=1 Tax=Ciceribacter sp. sgz301302 TaxID=3342379 RepID=UPI0035B8AF86